MANIKILHYLLLASLLFSFCFAISSFITASTCYCTPCNEALGLETVWKVHGGLSFETVLSGLIFCCYSCVGLYILSQEKGGEYFGFLVSSTLMTTILTFCELVMWGSQALMVYSLNGEYPQSGRYATVNPSSRSTFSADVFFTSILFVLYLLILLLIVTWRDEINASAYVTKNFQTDSSTTPSILPDDPSYQKTDLQNENLI